jgi:hypothetical protein
MMNKILLAIVVVGLTACGKVDQLEAHYTGYSKICIDQVTYIQFTSGAVVQVDQAGKPVACSK